MLNPPPHPLSSRGKGEGITHINQTWGCRTWSRRSALPLKRRMTLRPVLMRDVSLGKDMVVNHMVKHGAYFFPDYWNCSFSVVIVQGDPPQNQPKLVIWITETIFLDVFWGYPEFEKHPFILDKIWTLVSDLKYIYPIPLYTYYIYSVFSACPDLGWMAMLADHSIRIGFVQQFW